MKILAYILSMIIAPLFSAVPTLIMILIPIRFVAAFNQVAAWMSGIASGVIQVWIISLIFRWMTDSTPHFIFLIIYLLVQAVTLNSQIKSGRLKFGTITGSAVGLILGWLIFI